MPLPNGVEEAHHSFGQQGSGAFVPRGEAVIGEEMPVAPIEEQFAIGRAGNQCSRGVEVAFLNEALVRIHAVDLHGNLWRPMAPERGDRNAGLEEKRSGGAVPGLGEFLAGSTPSEKPAYTRCSGRALAASKPRSIRC